MSPNGLVDVGRTGGAAEPSVSLGDVYASGRGVTQRYGRAEQLYDQACDDGHGEACCRPADMHERGIGVTRGHAPACRLQAQSATPPGRGA